MLKQGIYEEIINTKLKDELATLETDRYEVGKHWINTIEIQKGEAELNQRLPLSYIQYILQKEQLKFIEQYLIF